MAVAEGLLGHHEQAMSDLKQAMRISPRDYLLAFGIWKWARQLLALGRYDEAIQEGLKAVDSGYRTVLSYTALAAFYAVGEQGAGGEVRAGARR